MRHIIAIQKINFMECTKDRLDAGTLHDVACAACVPEADRARNVRIRGN